MQVCSPTVSFMALGTYAIESTTAFSAHLYWLPNFLLDQSLPLMTLLRLVIFCAVSVLMSVHWLCSGQGVCGREKYMEEGCATAFVSANKGQGLPQLGAFFRWCVCMHAFLCVNATLCLLRVRNYHKCLWKCLTGSIDYVESQTPCFFPYFFWEVGKVL